LARILLVRAVSDIRLHRGSHALWVAEDMAADCGAELEEAGTATRELARVLVPGHDVDRNLVPAVVATRRLSRAVGSEDGAYARYSMATDPDTAIDRDRAGALGEEWDEQRPRHLARPRSAGTTPGRREGTDHGTRRPPVRRRGGRAARDLASLLPLTLDPEDFHGTERIGYPPRRPTTDGAPEPTAAKAGA